MERLNSLTPHRSQLLSERVLPKWRSKDSNFGPAPEESGDMWRALLRDSERIVELPVTSTSMLNTPEIDHISTCRTFRSSEKCHKT